MGYCDTCCHQRRCEAYAEDGHPQSCDLYDDVEYHRRTHSAPHHRDLFTKGVKANGDTQGNRQ